MIHPSFVMALILLSARFLCQAQVPNYRVSDPDETTPQEVSIAINPKNPLNLAAGSNPDFYYYSFDGGITWEQGRMTSPLGVHGDPCVAFDPEGNLLYAHLSNPPDNTGYWIDRIVVQKSVDGGMSWNDGVGVGLNNPRNQDKEWMAVDMTKSEYHNTVYMAWTEFDKYGSDDPEDSTRILFSRSEDAGESWSEPLRISDRGGDCMDSDSSVEGAVPAVGPQGQVYVSWSGPGGIFFDRSFDGGISFGRDIRVTDQPGGWDFRVPGLHRANGFPVTACDISDSRWSGTVYVLWSDQRNGKDNTDIFLLKSKDNGDSWAEIIRVNNDAGGRHQFFPWFTVDPVTGIIYVVFYDRRATEYNETEVWMARSEDGGESFSNFRISETSFIPLEFIFFGDYINVAARNGRVHPIWMRMDGTKRSIWTAVIRE